MDDSLPIWPQHEAFYIESMLFHTREACTSMEYVANLIAKINNDQSIGVMPAFDCSIALDHIQNVILRAAAISRYFWPSGKAHIPRGLFLQSAFKIGEDSPLLNRSLRNAAEHFDERLDSYLAGGIIGAVIPEWFGPTYPIEIPKHYFRAYFIDTGIFKILKDEFIVQPLFNELVRIHNLLVFFDRNGGRFPIAGS